MSDLVAKLRIEARRDPEIQHSGHSILSDAADEIERLRALLREADRLLSLSGVVFDPAPLQAQIAEALNQQLEDKA